MGSGLKYKIDILNPVPNRRYLNLFDRVLCCLCDGYGHIRKGICFIKCPDCNGKLTTKVEEIKYVKRNYVKVRRK